MEPQVFLCQQCKCRIVISASDTDPPLPGPSSNPSRLEESFMVLEDTLYGDRGPGTDSTAMRRMEESFVMLHPSKGPPGLASGGPAAASYYHHPPPASSRVPFYATLCALTNVLEVASQVTAVDHPVCADCAADVHRELDAQTADLQAELAAYDAALSRLDAENSLREGRPGNNNAEEDNDRQRESELAAAEAAVAAKRAELAAAEAEAAAVEAEVAALESAATELSASEVSYWHEHNAFQRRLAGHVAERASTAARLEQGAITLSALRRASVLNDAFRIWFSGPFGTVNGLRLGRTAAHPVPWPEVNAAWGAAVTLLAALVKQAGVQLRSGTLLPCGSYPKIADERGTHELFGPISKLLCPSYDRAQIAFLACLKEYADWLAQHTQQNREKTGGFSLPWAIEGDRVGSLSIRFMLSKDKNWTKALKYMLVDLKFCLKATMALKSSGQNSGAIILPEDEARGSKAGPAVDGASTVLPLGQRVGPLPDNRAGSQL